MGKGREKKDRGREERERGENGGRGKGRDRAPKLLLNEGPSKRCYIYATDKERVLQLQVAEKGKLFCIFVLLRGILCTKKL